jgi:transposase
MMQRGGEVIMRLVDNVQHSTIKPCIEAAMAPGTCLDIDADDIYSRLEPWG